MKNTISIIALLTGLSLVVSSCGKMGTYGSGNMRLRVETTPTKGTIVTTENFVAQNPEGFVMDAWLDEEAHDNSTGDVVNQHYIESLTIAYGGGVYDTEIPWVNSIKTRFWFWAPKESATRTVNPLDKSLIGANELEFNYSNPAPPSLNNDASAQKDILFAYGEYKWTDAKPVDEVDVAFKHALSEVGFLYSSSDGSFSPGLDISRISIKNVYGAGVCVFNGSAGTFAWTPSGGKNTYSQNYTLTSIPNLANDQKHMANAFFMIPQEIPSDAQLEITFRRLFDNSTLRRTVSISGDTWKAGKYYIYKITAITIDDDIQFSIAVTEWENGGSASLTPTV